MLRTSPTTLLTVHLRGSPINNCLLLIEHFVKSIPNAALPVSFFTFSSIFLDFYSAQCICTIKTTYNELNLRNEENNYATT